MTSVNALTKTHDLYIVKYNTGSIIRLARCTDILYNVKQEDRIEVEISNLTKEEAANPNWQTNCIIWQSPMDNFWYEATCDDKQAEDSYKLILKKLKDFPDVDPENPNSSGTLIKRISIGQRYTIVDGNARKPTRRVN